MSLSTFIAGLSENSGPQVRFQMPATVYQALLIAIKVFEKETQEKRILAIFSNSKTHRKGRGNFGQPWNTFVRSEYRHAARVSTDTSHAGRKQRQENARPTNTSCEAKLLCFECGKPGHFSKTDFQINFSPERTKERIGTPNRRKRESQAVLMPKLFVETQIVRKKLRGFTAATFIISFPQ